MILQFGAGNFLRAFADLFVQEANLDAASAVGPVVVVQSTGSERAEALNRAGGRYHVAVRGLREGGVVDETVAVGSIREALVAAVQWDRVLEAGRDPALLAIVSNTTEAGLSLENGDARGAGSSVPRSFPAKLLAVLLARREAGLPGPWIAPCELVERNGDRLRDLVREQAARWGVGRDGRRWLEEECRWVNTLVDRIVTGPPREHPLLGTDPLLVSAEPYALWAVETGGEGFFLRHPAVAETADTGSYALRKVRILNGAHTALVSKAASRPVKTVRACLEHGELGPWLERLLFEEIVPVLEGRCEDPCGFAREVLERFRNPFLEHRLSSIALHHETKLEVRLRPTYEEYRERYGRTPRLLAEVLG